MRQQVRIEQGIIEAVDGAIPRISPLAVMPKDGYTRLICRYTQGEPQDTSWTPLIVEDLTDTLNGVLVFSKLYFHARYHQLLLDEESRYITTFQTNKDLHLYRTLNFGASSASEYFNMLSPNNFVIFQIFNIYEDMIVFLKTNRDIMTLSRKFSSDFCLAALPLTKQKDEFNMENIPFLVCIFRTRNICGFF